MVEFYTICLILALLCALSVVNTYINGLYFDNFTFWSVLQTIYGLCIAGATCYIVYKGWVFSGGLAKSGQGSGSRPSIPIQNTPTVSSTSSYVAPRSAPTAPMNGRRY
jgi:hypothetical protein